ncbi:type II toxin-antitoxin system HicA family toxin [Moritella sp.]|uniref:type II toxin-antitoxin system HicA family toxin n=1 Tax=Moritella sp. TaxID=78556 RepID=UPI0025D1CAD7|nr:type II toxin-antitoxin system HicA family toxin [Moritella sp.]
MRSAELIKLVTKKGWVLVRVNGSHHHFKHPDHSHLLTIPHPKQELGKGILRKLKKQAGL